MKSNKELWHRLWDSTDVFCANAQSCTCEPWRGTKGRGSRDSKDDDLRKWEMNMMLKGFEKHFFVLFFASGDCGFLSSREVWYVLYWPLLSESVFLRLNAFFAFECVFCAPRTNDKPHQLNILSSKPVRYACNSPWALGDRIQYCVLSGSPFHTAHTNNFTQYKWRISCAACSWAYCSL